MTKKTNLDQLKSDIRIMGAYLPNALAIEHLAQTQGIFLDEYLRATDIWRAFGAIQRAVAAGGRVLSSTTTTSAALLARMGALGARRDRSSYLHGSGTLRRTSPAYAGTRDYAPTLPRR